MSARETCDGVADAICERFQLVLSVPGHPISHIAEILAARLPRHEWAFNEKAAFEAAVGASLVGVPACVLMKHNGLSFAFDSLANAALHTIGAPLLVVVGDDPDAESSTTAQDSRALAATIHVPVLEPRLTGDTRKVVETAKALSGDHRTPVIVRLTPHVHATCQVSAVMRRPRPPYAPPTSYSSVNVDAVAHSLTKLGRAQQRRINIDPAIRATLEDKLADRYCGRTCNTAVLRIGAAAIGVDHGVECEMASSVGWPVPDSVIRFVEDHTRIVVLEDSAPVVEGYLRGQTRSPERIVGRLSGHLPPEGAVIAQDIERATSGQPLHTWLAVTEKLSGIDEPDHWHSLFTAVARLRRQGTFVASDVGSSVRLCYPPYAGADAALSLGSSVAVAGGAARCGHKAVALIGDYALLHSGIAAILDVIANHLPVLIIVMANGVQEKTGGQPIPAINLKLLLEAGGTHVASVGAADITPQRLQHLLTRPLPSVLLVEHASPCT